MVFSDVVFPVCISYGSEFRATYDTIKTEVLSGAEQRVTRQEYVRNVYKINTQNMPAEELAQIVNIFHVCAGDLYGFLFLDPTDHTSANNEQSHSGSVITPYDQPVLQDPYSGEWHLFKIYRHASRVRRRRIRRPILKTMTVKNDGNDIAWRWGFGKQAVIIEEAGFDPATARLTAGFEYYVPVRFDTGELGIEPTAGLNESLLSDINDLKLIEIFE